MQSIPATEFETSTQIGHLTESLAKASAEFGEILKEAENSYYGSKYADLSALINATRKALGNNGLALIQIPTVNRDDNAVTVTSVLSHTSNERIVTAITLPMAKPDAHGIASAITYARRYSYQSILNIAGEEDDDGNAAVGKTQEERRSKASDTGDGIINPVQQRAFVAACKTGGRTDQQVNDWLRTIGVETVEQLSKIDFNMAIKWALNANRPNIQEQIEKSIAAAEARKKKKPQPIVAAQDVTDPEEQIAGD